MQLMRTLLHVMHQRLHLLLLSSVRCVMLFIYT